MNLPPICLVVKRVILLVKPFTANRLTNLAAIAFGILFFSATQSSAAIVASTLNLPILGPAAVGVGNWTGFVFTTDNSTYTLNSITVRLNIGSEPEDGLELQPTLTFANENNLPAGEPITVGFSSPSWVAAGYQDYVFEATSPVTLAANTTYVFTLQPNTPVSAVWAVADADQPTESSWDLPAVVVQSGTSGEIWNDAGVGTIRALFAIDAQAIPEPMTAAMAAMGVLAFLRRRRA